MKNASAIFFLSDSYKKIVFNKYVPNQLIDELNNKTFIIPNGIDDFWINNRFINKKKKNLNSTINIIYAGIIDANKNIETTQKALEKIRNQGINTNFTVVGKIGDTKIYNRLMKYPNTKYYQNMTKEELLKLYRKNDIFVMPSITETFGLVYAEAMSQGLPIIYTRNQGFDGQFDDGVVGFSVDSKSCNEIAFKILRIINCYESMSDNCINYCRKFDWNGICQIYFDLYYSLLR